MSSEYKKAKDKAWKVFSRYIRLRDALKTTGDTEYARCYTCGRLFHIKEMDAGHWITRNRMPTFMNHRNVNAQCRGCNRFGDGRVVEYQAHLIEEYGSTVLEQLTETAQKQVKLKAGDWNTLSEQYKQLVSMLEGGEDWRGASEPWEMMLETKGVIDE